MPKDWRIGEDGRVYKKGRKLYPNKDVYEGEFVNGKREGRGTLFFAFGDQYVGTWENNLFHGFGIFTYAPFVEKGRIIRSRRYEGFFKAGKRSGNGLYILGNGDSYDGNFERGLFCGQGTYTHKNGDMYSGLWYRGKLAGQTRIEYACGDVFEGEMQLGKFHGQGKFTWAFDRGFFEGTYKSGLMDGRARRVYANGNQYDGEFKEGVLHGDGFMRYRNGDEYAGQWENGFFHGKGSLKMAHGDTYEGEFYCGQFHGQGRYVYADGGTYEGQYTATKTLPGSNVIFPDPNGKKHGYGVRVWVSGNRYEGNWRDGQIHGKGVVVNADGSRFEGQFLKGAKWGLGEETWGNLAGVAFRCPMGYKHNGKGFCKYEGNYENGKFHGEGSFFCCDGRKYIGNWRYGKRHGAGEMRYIPDAEEGDPDRHYIGGTGAMYRTARYVGEWADGERTGMGKTWRSDGTSLEGEFYRGHVDGDAVYTYPSGRWRTAFYMRGDFRRWTSELQDPVEEDNAPREKVEVEDALGAFSEGLRNPTAVLSMPPVRIV